MNYVGISAGFHDAAMSVINRAGEIKFASHAERFCGYKHYDSLHIDLVKEAMSHVHGNYELHFYERPWVKAMRQFKAGQTMGPYTPAGVIGDGIMPEFGKRKIHTHGHHLSHAAAGFQTSPFDDATVVIIDAIGELDTISIWHAEYDEHNKAKYTRLWSKGYPNSIGLFYSAMTGRVGLKPLDEEYILMGMAAYGNPKHDSKLLLDNVSDLMNLDFKTNLHAGVGEDYLAGATNEDLAASTQVVAETLIRQVMLKAAWIGRSKNLVYGGGVALNCLANRMLGEMFDKIWIMPNPGDAGSSLGAAALGYKRRVQWNNAYLGYNIEGEYPVKDLMSELLTNKIVGVASGRAEFGPRALGNRSLLADPRGDEIKDAVNEIKRRQKFRPFAPVILEEEVDKYFVMPVNWTESRYMQVIATCKFPDQFPAIVHHDGTSRVQTVPKDGSGIRHLLEDWYQETGCPMLLNTSLNVRGEPMVNDRSDADRFEQFYKVKVCS